MFFCCWGVSLLSANAGNMVRLPLDSELRCPAEDVCRIATESALASAPAEGLPARAVSQLLSAMAQLELRDGVPLAMRNAVLGP